MSNIDLRVPYKSPCPDGGRLISLTQGQWAIVDEDMYDKLMQWKWCAWWSKCSNSYYAVRGTSVAERAETRCSTIITMHRQIMGVEFAGRKIQVDHLHYVTLDNRVSELKLVTCRQNHRNLKNPGTSKYSNVCWHKTRGRWQVDIGCAGDKVRVCMGRYKDEDEAGVVAKIARNYVDVNPECTAQDLKDLRIKIKTDRGKLCQK